MDGGEPITGQAALIVWLNSWLIEWGSRVRARARTRPAVSHPSAGRVPPRPPPPPPPSAGPGAGRRAGGLSPCQHLYGALNIAGINTQPSETSVYSIAAAEILPGPALGALAARRRGQGGRRFFLCVLRRSRRRVIVVARRDDSERSWPTANRRHDRTSIHAVPLLYSVCSLLCYVIFFRTLLLFLDLAVFFFFSGFYRSMCLHSCQAAREAHL